MNELSNELVLKIYYSFYLRYKKNKIQNLKNEDFFILSIGVHSCSQLCERYKFKIEKF